MAAFDSVVVPYVSFHFSECFDAEQVHVCHHLFSAFHGVLLQCKQTTIVLTPQHNFIGPAICILKNTQSQEWLRHAHPPIQEGLYQIRDRSAILELRFDAGL